MGRGEVVKFLDLFAGIGGFRLGMEQAGHECVGYVEIDKYARKSYEAIHDTEEEWTAHDIKNVTIEEFRSLRGTVDIICGGFPCQSFSIAGKRGGFSDTRGTLFFDIARAAKEIKPQFLFLENVKGLLNHKSGETFRTILTAIDELGYDAEWQICNSKNFGVPQNRERVFIVGHLRGSGGREVFPIEGKNGEPIKVVGQLEGKYRSVNEILDTSGSSTCLNTMGGGNREPKIIIDDLQSDKFGGIKTYEDIAPTLRSQRYGLKVVAQPVLTPDRPNKRQNGRRFKKDGEEMFTLTGQDKHGVMVAGNINPSGNGMNGQVYRSGGLSPTITTNKGEGPKIENALRIRKLTPKECWRLQGFPDWAFQKAEQVNSNSQLYKQAGNSVTVNVVHEIAKRLKEDN